MEDIKNEREKIDKIKCIIEREIEKELLSKQNEVTDISEKIKNVLRHLDLLKYIVAVNYYDQNTTLTQKKTGQEDETEEEKAQTQIHPCIKKLMPFRVNYNKAFGDFISSHSYETRNSKKSIGSGEPLMGVKKNHGIGSVGQEKCQNSNNMKMPQYIPPLPSEEETVGTVNSTRGSVSKECYRVVVGNISKWIPPDTREDNSTHKWMVYIRNKDPEKDVTLLLKKVRYFLHESYKPHDIIDVTSPPFRLTRRGWGEFPIRVQLHFVHPLDKPIDVIHNLKLDMSCSGAQMLGGETVIEISLHRNVSGSQKKEAPKWESGDGKGGAVTGGEEEEVEATKEKQDVFDGSLITNLNGFKLGHCAVEVKKEVEDEENEANNGVEESDDVVNQEPDESFDYVKLLDSRMDEMNDALTNSRKYMLDRRKILKTIEVEHNYLKTNENQLQHKRYNNLINSSVKLETVNQTNLERNLKNGVLLNSVEAVKSNANHVINVTSSGSEEEVFRNLKAATKRLETESQSKYSMKMFRHMYLVNVVQRARATGLTAVEALVRWFVQRWPIVTDLSSDPAYKTVHPYSSPTEEDFFASNIGKQRSSEWFRAKAIQKVLKSLKTIVPIEEEIWSTKQILLWSRFHGYTPTSPQKNPKLEARENELRGKRLKPNDSSSESDEESSDNPNKKPRSVEEKFLNGVNASERKKSHRRVRRKEQELEEQTRTRNYRGCNTCSDANDSRRFGADVFRTQPDSPSEIDVVTVDEKPAKEVFSKKREEIFSVTTIPTGEILLNKFAVETAKEIGVRIGEEELVPGVKVDSVSRVLTRCVSTFLDELLRRSLANGWMRNGQRCPESLEVNDILTTLVEHSRFDIFTNRGLGIERGEKS